MDVDHLKINITQSVTEVLNYSTDAIKKPTYMFMYTVPDRSNLTGNALLERKWNAKRNAAGTPRERQNFCGVGARSEQERILLRTR